MRGIMVGVGWSDKKLAISRFGPPAAAGGHDAVEATVDEAAAAAAEAERKALKEVVQAMQGAKVAMLRAEGLAAIARREAAEEEEEEVLARLVGMQHEGRGADGGRKGPGGLVAGRRGVLPFPVFADRSSGFPGPHAVMQIDALEAVNVLASGQLVLAYILARTWRKWAGSPHLSCNDDIDV